MPRISDVNLFGWLLSAVAMYLFGFVWYGVLFSQAWMAGNGYTEAMYAGNSPLWMPSGFIIPALLAFGLGWHLKQADISSLRPSVLFGLRLSVLIGVPLMMYNYIYGPQHAWEVLLIDSGHTVLTFMIGAAVLSFFD